MTSPLTCTGVQRFLKKEYNIDMSTQNITKLADTGKITVASRTTNNMRLFEESAVRDFAVRYLEKAQTKLKAA